jgi:RES domain-containing protein
VNSVYRLINAAFAEDALSGEGARRYGGRWNPPGFAVVYTSQSRALAALETLVHLTVEARTLRFTMIEIQMPQDTAPEAYEGAASVWRHQGPSSVTQEVGRDWLERANSQILAVPSVVVPQELNFVLNVAHPRFSQLRVARREPFAFDERFWKS